MEQIFEKNETGKGKKKKQNRKVEFVLQYSDFTKSAIAFHGEGIHPRMSVNHSSQHRQEKRKCAKVKEK